MRSRLGRIEAAARADAHLGLRYERLAPALDGEDKDNKDKAKNAWLDRVAETQISENYGIAFNRWRDSMNGPNTRVQLCSAAGRLFVGHGNPSGSDVGLTVHHTWGVPMVPGSALKGVLAHHVAASYGGDDEDRRPWRGVTRDQGRATRSPGELYRMLFGAPAVDDQSSQARACVGAVIFHDALYVPGSCPADRPFVRDVITVHQKTYYNSHNTAPNDYDDPNPIGFVNVKPGAHFLLALSGDPHLTAPAMHLLLEALEERGVGGKTSLGYGRLVAAESASSAVKSASSAVRSASSAVLREFLAALKSPREQGGLSAHLERILEEWPPRLRGLSAEERRRAATKLESKSSKILDKPQNAELAHRIRAWVTELRSTPLG